MIKLNKKKDKIEMIGAHDEIVAEVQVAMMALLDNTAKVDKKLAKETFLDLVKAIAACAHLLEDEYKIDCQKILDKYLEEECD